MSGQWNRTPRKGEKSINAVRSDQEHAVRKEYRNAGIVDGLVIAWCITNDEQGSCERDADREPWESIGALRDASLAIACELVERFPKQGRMALSDAGATTEYLDHVENTNATRRRLLAAAVVAAKLESNDDGA